jgi:predicted ribosomally synthesized peptide with nif11-like leader
MSIENLHQFQSRVASDAALKGKVQAIHEAVAREFAEKIAALSAEVGTPFTAEEYLAARELTDAELEGASGGINEYYRRPNLYIVPDDGD